MELIYYPSATYSLHTQELKTSLFQGTAMQMRFRSLFTAIPQDDTFCYLMPLSILMERLTLYKP